jgi:hypothetical protein
MPIRPQALGIGAGPGAPGVLCLSTVLKSKAGEEKTMRLLRILFPVWMACTMVCGAAAQEQSGATMPDGYAAQGAPAAGGVGYGPTDGPPAAAQGPAPAAAGAGREWVPEGIAALGRTANWKTEFTLDHTILKFATMLDRNNPDLQRVVAGVNGVSVHIFRFPAGFAMDPGVMASISQQYQEAGWMHLVKKRKNQSGETTDLWVRLDATTIRDVAVLMVRAAQVDFVSESGSVAPLDLMHLSGHFGIPKMDGGMAVPVPGRRP